MDLFMYLFLSWIYCPSFILNLLTDGNIFNVFHDWRCWSSSARHFWYNVAEVCVYRTKKPVEVQEMLLSLTNQRPISQLKPGNTDSVASTPPVRRRKLSAPRSRRRTVMTETSPLRRVAAFWPLNFEDCSVSPVASLWLTGAHGGRWCLASVRLTVSTVGSLWLASTSVPYEGPGSQAHHRSRAALRPGSCFLTWGNGDRWAC